MGGAFFAAFGKGWGLERELDRLSFGLTIMPDRGERSFVTANDTQPFRDETPKGWATQFSSG
jgi:hypothetical protein